MISKVTYCPSLLQVGLLKLKFQVTGLFRFATNRTGVTMGRKYKQVVAPKYEMMDFPPGKMLKQSSLLLLCQKSLGRFGGGFTPGLEWLS